MKNSYGFVYGKNQAIGHTKYPSGDSFARMLIDLNQYVKPRFYIMDGITAMEEMDRGSRVGSHEHDSDVHRSVALDKCVCKTGLSETGDGS